MALVINQKLGRVGINRTDAFINIESQRSTVKIRSRQPEVQINVQPAQVEIDQKQCFNEAGLKTVDAFTRDMAAKARSQCKKDIASTAQKGDFLARVDINRNAIPVLAQKAMQNKTDYTIVAMPRSRPEIHFSGGTDINFQMGSMEIETIVQRSEISATRGNVEVYFSQKPYIEVEYKNEGFNRTI